MARFEFDGVDEVINELEHLENEPFDCVCSACGKHFQATQEILSKETVTCPHCGAELDEV